MTAAKRLPVSVCLIAGNEARRIRRALASVADWTSEIVVVLNDDVNDGTDQISAEFGARVFREPWKGHIAQKNSAVGKATQPWLFGLDADEEVSAALRFEIEKWFSEPAKLVDISALSFPRCTWFFGRWIRHGDWYPDRQTRLWRRGTAEWGGVDPHDKLLVRGRTQPLRSELLHHNAESIDHQIEKISRYSNDFLQDALTHGRAANGRDIFTRSLWRFLRSYFFRFGFLDGWQGCYIAWMTAFYTATRYAKVLAVRESKEPSN